MKAISSYQDSHFNENFTIHEAGMKLTPQHYSKIRARLESLESRAPAISTIHLKFIAQENEIKGELVIIGVRRNFSSEIRGQDPWEIYKTLEEDIDTQLISWKKTRFLEKYVDLPIPKEHEQFVGGYAI